MRWLAAVVSRRGTAWLIVITVVVIAALAVTQAARLAQDDDLLAFLPQDNPEVQLFYEINDEFGGTDVALVGIEVEDPFAPAFLRALHSATERLADLPTLDHVLSLTNVIDFTPDDELGGIVTDKLVNAIPTTDAERAALRQRVFSRDHIVGNLISDDGKALVIYCYLSYGINPKLVAAQIHAILEETLPAQEKYWGGAPFISTYIYNTVQEDLRKLTPWAVLAIVAIMMLVFRDPIGTSLVLLSTAMGIVVSLGVMALLGVSFNIVLSATPVVLFAIGSAYGLHILARYYARTDGDDETALRRTIIETGPVVIAAGLTTAVSLLSFVCMDIRPVRIFGIFTSLGILVALILAITFIPAVIHLARLKRRATVGGFVPRWTAGLARAAGRRRLPVGIGLAVLVVTAGVLVSTVDSSVDMTTFFNRGSPPDRAAVFLREHFGGSQFIQIRAAGDMNDPDVLRQVRLVGDQVSLLPHVASVVHIGDALALSNNAMVGQLRIPDTPPQVKLLYSFVTTDRAVSQLVTRDRTKALIHVKVDSETAAVQGTVIDQVTDIVRALGGSFAAAGIESAAGQNRLRSLVLWRIRALARRYGVDMEEAARAELAKALTERPEKPDAEAVAAASLRFIRSAECAIDPTTLVDGHDPAPAIATAAVALGPDPDEVALAEVIATTIGRSAEDPEIEDLAFSMAAPLREMWLNQRAWQHAEEAFAAAELRIPEGDRGERFKRAAATALVDLDAPTAITADNGEGAAVQSLAFAVNGMPVMHRGMSRSITRNQLLSLGFALILVLLIMSFLFRSLISGLLGITPTVITVLVVYGGMGLMGVHLDFGTSMLASLILGAGVDYAVHLLSAWKGGPDQTLEDVAAAAAGTTGTAIWTNSVMIGAGFLVLTMGEARPLKNVGGLTAAAMLVAAAATFIVIPVLARRRRYRPNAGLSRPSPDGSEEAENGIIDIDIVVDPAELGGSKSRK